MSDAFDARDPVEALAEEFIARLRSGQNPSVSEYVDKHPEVSAEIRDLFPTLLMMEKYGSVEDTDELKSDTRLNDEAAVPKQLGDYQILKKVGHGGMGIVYEAIHESLGRHVALKVLPASRLASDVQLARFQREARAAAHLHHTNIVPVFDVGQQDGVHFYAMQFIQGQGLDEILTELKMIRGKLSEKGLAARHSLISSVESSSGQNNFGMLLHSDSGSGSSGTQSNNQYFGQVARIGSQIAEALAYAHHQGVLHRDIKPANLLLDYQGTVWITDFGLAKTEESEDLTRDGGVVGTLRYMAPERFQSKSLPESDIYSVGVTLYELLTHRPAFDDSDRMRLMQRIAKDDPLAPRQIDVTIPRDLETIVLKALDKEPARRYRTAESLANDLNNFLADRPITARRSTSVEKVWRWCRRNPAVATLTALVALLVLTVAIGSSIAAGVWKHQRDVVSEQKSEIAKEKMSALNAKDEAIENLWQAKVAHARAARASLRAGRRKESLDAITQAAAIRPTMELRNAAIASMSLVDLQIQRQWTGKPLTYSLNSIDFSPSLRYYACETEPGIVGIKKSGSSDTLLARLPEVKSHKVYRALFGPNEKLLAVAYSNSAHGIRIQIWDWQTETKLFEIKNGAIHASIAFSPDSRQVAIGFQSKTIKVFDLNDGSALETIACKAIPYRLSYSPDGKRLAASTQSRGVYVWDLLTPDVPLRQFALAGFGRMLSWSPTGEILAAACNDRKIYLWNVDVNFRYPELAGHNSEAWAVHFHPTGRFLVSSGWDGKTLVWNYYEGQLLTSIEGHAIRFSKNGNRLAVQDGQKLSIYDVNDAQECWEFHSHSTLEKSLVVDLDRLGRRLAVGGNYRLNVWDLEQRRLIGRRKNGQTDHVAFHPVTDDLTTNGSKGLWRWSIESDPVGELQLGEKEAIRDYGNVVCQHAAWSSDGQTFAATVLGSDPRIVVEYGDGKRRILRSPNLYGTSISPDGKWIATGNWQGTDFKVWDRDTGDAVLSLKTAGNAQPFFSPDGKWLVAATGDRFAFFEVGSWVLKMSINRRNSGNQSGAVDFTEDSKTVALGISRFSIVLFDVAEFRELATLETVPLVSRVGDVCFTPDGNKLVAACSTHGIRVWDLRKIRQQLSKMDLDWDDTPSAEKGDAAQ